MAGTTRQPHREPFMGVEIDCERAGMNPTRIAIMAYELTSYRHPFSTYETFKGTWQKKFSLT